MKCLQEPLDYFYLLFDLLDLIAEETNRYAQDKGTLSLKKKWLLSLG